MAENSLRATPSSKGKGEYFRVELRNPEEFVTFRTHDVGKSGHTKRLVGKRSDGAWATQAWLISKQDAHMDKGILVGDTPHVRSILSLLTGAEGQVGGDVFEGHNREAVYE